MSKVIAKIVRKLRRKWPQFFVPNEWLKQIDDYSKNFQSGISIALTNACNADCVFCAYQYQKRSLTFLDEKTLEKIAQGYETVGGGHVSLVASVGDSLLDPNFWDRFHQLKKFPSINRIHITTNLIAASKVGIEKLALEGPDDFLISMGGFDAETYQRVFRSSKYQEVFDSLIKICELRKAHGRPIGITVTCRTDKPLLYTLTRPDYWKLRKYLNFSDISIMSKGFDNWAGKIQEKDLLPGQTLMKLDAPGSSPCVQLYAHLGFYPDGLAIGCACRDLEGDSELVVGNIKDVEMGELGKRVEKLRSNWKKGQIPEICKSCTMYQSIDSQASNQFIQDLKKRHNFITHKT